MRLGRKILLLLLCVSMGLFSCEIAEKPIDLPPQGPATMVSVSVGDSYEDQLFFDLEKGEIVKTSKVASWDLAFETSADGFHVFINGGKNLFAYNTRSANLSQLVNAQSVPFSEWGFDAPSGSKDSTAVGDWRQADGSSKMEVYYLKFHDGTFKKFMIGSANEDEYLLYYGDETDPTLQSIVIPKNPDYTYSYFSFNNGGQLVYPDPPKASWDIVFSQYRHIYYELNNFPYLVQGILLNPYQTKALVDSTTSFDAINAQTYPESAFTTTRDIIGFAWKRYDLDAGKYTTNPAVVYVIRNRNGQIWKMRFLDFYGPNGEKGHPTFEIERIY